MCRRLLTPLISVLFLLTLPFASVHAQLPGNIDYSSINVDNLSDQQLSELLQRARQSGLSIDDIVQQAQSKGMPPDQVAKLRDRLTALSAGSVSLPVTNPATVSVSGRTYQKEYLSPQDSIENLEAQEREKFRKRIFGADLFSTANLTFEPNLNIATPGNYIIGPGDELDINVYGYSEKNDKLKVSPDGEIDISNVGPVEVSGLTIDEARDKITNKLESIYSEIKKGNTHVQVLLGNIRSIQVMVIGEIMRPGSYTLPSLATVVNALYVSGGPDADGSFRDIQVVRNGKVISHFDLYDFLVWGTLKGNVLLQDQDIVKVNPYNERVILSGEVKHPAIFEAKDSESVSNMITYAGGYTNDAYKGFVRLIRISNGEREVITVPGDSTKMYDVEGGDSLYVDSAVSIYSNRVQIGGDVFHPGAYSLQSAPTLRDLISQSGGVKDDAFLTRALLSRLKPDRTPEMIDFNVSDVLTGKVIIPLQREDSVHIYDKQDLREKYYVIVRGEVNHPDTVPYAEHMHVEDAILESGGLKDAAALNEVEVGRRLQGQQYKPADTALAIVDRFTIQRDLENLPGRDTMALQPFDEIMVRHAPGYHELTVVKIEGEVVFPGSYVVDSKSEKLSDLVRKAGGLKMEAYPEGALLLRKKTQDSAQTYLRKSELDLFAEANKGNDSLELRKINRLDSTLDLVGINLDKAIASPGSKYDLLLVGGDIVRVPKRLETVSLYGQVFYPKQVRFESRYRFKDFISQAGGFTADALRRRSYIVYPNGEVSSTRKVIFFNRYPKVKAGGEIFVPARKENKGLSTEELIGLSSSIVAVLGVLIAVLK